MNVYSINREKYKMNIKVHGHKVLKITEKSDEIILIVEKLG
jgi:hypothetical protein